MFVGGIVCVCACWWHSLCVLRGTVVNKSPCSANGLEHEKGFCIMTAEHGGIEGLN